jgi:hypothetical protein
MAKEKKKTDQSLTEVKKRKAKSSQYKDTLVIKLGKDAVLKTESGKILCPLETVLKEARAADTGIYSRFTTNVIRGHYHTETAIGLRMVDTVDPMAVENSSVVLSFQIK